MHSDRRQARAARSSNSRTARSRRGFVLRREPGMSKLSRVTADEPGQIILEG